MLHIAALCANSLSRVGLIEQSTQFLCGNPITIQEWSIEMQYEARDTSVQAHCAPVKIHQLHIEGAGQDVHPLPVQVDKHIHYVLVPHR